MKQKIQTGFFLHVHHDVLLEWCHNYDERVAYIRKEKSKEEQGTRLRLFKPVKGTLPQEVNKARQKYYKAGQEYDKAWQEYDKAGQELNKARQKYYKAGQEYDKAWQEYSKVLNDNKELIEALHKAECPN